MVVHVGQSPETGPVLDGMLGGMVDGEDDPLMHALHQSTISGTTGDALVKELQKMKGEHQIKGPESPTHDSLAKYRGSAVTNILGDIAKITLIPIASYILFLALDGRLIIPVFEGYYSRHCTTNPADCIGISENKTDNYVAFVGSFILFLILQRWIRHLLVQLLVMSEHSPLNDFLIRLTIVVFLPIFKGGDDTRPRLSRGNSIMLASIKDIVSGRVVAHGSNTTFLVSNYLLGICMAMKLALRLGVSTSSNLSAVLDISLVLRLVSSISLALDSLLQDLVMQVGVKDKKEGGKSGFRQLHITVHLLIWCVSIWWAMWRLEFALPRFSSNVISALGFGGIVAGLALQATLKDFFGSLSIFLSRPFRVGDYISILSSSLASKVSSECHDLAQRCTLPPLHTGRLSGEHRHHRQHGLPVNGHAIAGGADSAHSQRLPLWLLHFELWADEATAHQDLP
jgi:small-conductance mechanosensitive channel